MSVFDGVADRYDAVRPDYPDELFDDLVELARLSPEAHLLEVGCATGKATRPLLARGFQVTCVELGANLAAIAPSKANVHVGAFESFESDSAFDLVFAATAWHWLDPDVRYRKAHALLRAGGHLAFWTASHAFPDDFDPFFTEIQVVYDEIGESHPGEWPPPTPDETADDAGEIVASGLFERPVVRRYVWAMDYTADEYIALLDTFSGHIAMPADARAHLYDEIRRRLGASSVHRHWQAFLHVARRR